MHHFAIVEAVALLAVREVVNVGVKLLINASRKMYSLFTYEVRYVL